MNSEDDDAFGSISDEDVAILDEFVSSTTPSAGTIPVPLEELRLMFEQLKDHTTDVELVKSTCTRLVALYKDEAGKPVVAVQTHILELNGPLTPLCRRYA